MGNNLRNVRTTPVEIELDKKRTLLFDFNAYADLEEEFGDVEGALKALTAGKFSTLRKFIYIGLKQEDDSLTEREVGKLMGTDPNSLQYQIECLNHAINGTLPEQKEGDETTSDPNSQKTE